MSVLLRPAAAADADAIGVVYLASRQTLLAFAPLAHTDDEVRDWIANALLPSGNATVAVDDGCVVGMMAISRDGKAGWINQLYLAPAKVGRGIGSQLVDLAKSKLGTPIRLYTFQENLAARRFYERRGFRAVAFTDGRDNEEKCPDVLYEWSSDWRGTRSDLIKSH